MDIQKAIAEGTTSKIKSGKYILKRKNGSTKVVTINNEPSMTDQSLKKECDVNHIINNFTRTGQLSHVMPKEGRYMDLSNIPELSDGLMLIKRAEEAFKKMPQKIRSEFPNIESFMEFLSDPNNDKKAIDLGLKSGPKSTDTKEPKKEVDPGPTKPTKDTKDS